MFLEFFHIIYVDPIDIDKEFSKGSRDDGKSKVRPTNEGVSAALNRASWGEEALGEGVKLPPPIALRNIS